MERISTQSASRGIGPYSQAVRANGFVFVSGQLGLDPETGQLVPGGFPDTEVAQHVRLTAQRVLPPYLLNHSVRTFLFGALLAKRKRLRVDTELFFVACMLHDLGLVDPYRGPLPFEIESANHAKAILEVKGYRSQKIEVVWDGIAMHTLAVADFKRPEIRFVSAGASADVTGFGIPELDPDSVARVVKDFPRLGMKVAFVETCAEVVRRHPGGAGRTFMRDIGERHVVGFTPTNICDRIDSAPFAE